MHLLKPWTWFATRTDLQVFYALLIKEIQSASASQLKALAQTNLDILKLAEQIDSLEAVSQPLDATDENGHTLLGEKAGEKRT